MRWRSRTPGPTTWRGAFFDNNNRNEECGVRNPRLEGGVVRDKRLENIGRRDKGQRTSVKVSQGQSRLIKAEAQRRGHFAGWSCGLGHEVGERGGARARRRKSDKTNPLLQCTPTGSGSETADVGPKIGERNVANGAKGLGLARACLESPEITGMASGRFECSIVSRYVPPFFRDPILRAAGFRSGEHARRRVEWLGCEGQRLP